VPVLISAAALLGLAVGSFLNVVVHRVPSGLSLMRPGSHCPACSHPIRTRDNVPVLGWLLLKGCCRDCREAIPVRYPLVELVTAVVFVLVAVRLSQLDLLAALPAFGWFAAVAIALALIDLDTGRLPDALVLPTYPVLAALLGVAAFVAGDPAGLLRAGIGAAVSFVAFYAVAVAKPGGMGFGDVKTAGLVGGVLAFVSYPVLVVGLAAGFLLGALGGLAVMAARRATRHSTLPYGPFLVTGALASLLVGAPVAHAYSRLFLTA